MAKKDELEFEGGIENTPKPNNSEKLKALQAAMDKIEKSFGKGSIMKMGDDHVQEVEVIPTGSIALNAALGVGGYPKGRIIEIYVRNLPVRPHWPSMPLPKHRKPAVLLLSSMQNMLSTVFMQPSWEWTSTTCVFHNPTTVNRHWKLLNS